ncbi:MAG: hypothetical protein JW944_00675 [Deltaproteobacteria bacterium]|nr:hypothetical protein [Deltaproteobacteria bacterium]
MKAISIRPPWPYCIFHLGKDIENRDMKFKHRGPLIIHSSKTWDRLGYLYIKRNMGIDIPDMEHHTFGRLEGIVEVTDCVGASDSKWFFGKYGLVLSDPREFEEKPIYRGMPGLFQVPDEIIKLITFRK